MQAFIGRQSSARAKQTFEDRIEGCMPARQATTKMQEIKLAHSPDSDDAFMFYALATNRVKVPGLRFTHVLSDIETLNQAADRETYDVTAISFSAYAYLRQKYVLLDCGASFGEGYGPIVVANHPMTRKQLAGSRIAIPGLRTSAFLTLRLYEPSFEPVPMAFDQIIDAVRAGTVDAGLLIHEGQLQFPEMGLHRVVDLGQWWLETTKLPLPLGGNAVRRALGQETGELISRAIRESVAYGLEHREEALNYAMQFARDMNTELADKFVGMYVNSWTLSYGERGRLAVQELLNRGYDAGLLPGPATAEFLSEALQ
jgi:1,4-dihydroxy-6-naphthoate synthase